MLCFRIRMCQTRRKLQNWGILLHPLQNCVLEEHANAKQVILHHITMVTGATLQVKGVKIILTFL